MSESHHFYKPDGTACHTIVGANGKERPTNIKDARKLGLLPSVSGITRVLAAPDLEDWKTRQILQKAYEVPPAFYKDVESYSRHVKEAAMEQVDSAAELGTLLHKALEAYFTQQPYDFSRVVTLTTGEQRTIQELIAPAIAKVAELGLEIVEAEKVLVNLPYRYAGTSDLLYKRGGKAGVLDFKSKKTSVKYKIKTVPSYPMQIAAYFAAYWGNGQDYPISDSAEGINLYLSTTQPGRVEAVVYDSERLEAEWQAFKHCRALYKHRWKL